MAMPRLSGPAALLALLLLGACDSDAANLAREITDARGDCNQEKLKASDSACVEMMQKYATIGTSAIETYIGAVKSMDQALQRMPPANFDTTGFGHALTPANAAAGAGDSLRTRASLYPGPAGYGAASRDGYGAGYDARGPRSGSPADPRYADPRYDDPRYDDPGSSDPRTSAPGFQDQDPRYQDPREPGPAYSGRRYPDGNDPDPRDPGRGDARARSGDPRATPAERGGYGTRSAPRAPESAARGLLLPPEQRLDRPWLRTPEDAEPGEPGEPRERRPRAGRPDGYLPSRPLSADTRGPQDEDRPRARRPEGY